MSQALPANLSAVREAHRFDEAALAAYMKDHVEGFAPPLVVVGVKTDSGAYALVKNTKTFALNMLGKDQKGLAFTFFKPAQLADGKISGQAFRKGANGAPILDAASAAVECKVTAIIEQGDHHIVAGEVTEAHLAKPPAGRPDAAILEMKDLGDNVFYGG